MIFHLQMFSFLENFILCPIKKKEIKIEISVYIFLEGIFLVELKAFMMMGYILCCCVVVWLCCCLVVLLL